MLESLIKFIPVAFILVGGSILFTFLWRRGQIKPVTVVRTLTESKASLRGLNLALAGTLGVGNILGVVNAVRIAGPGAVFWMVASSVIAASLKYAEGYLAVKTRKDGMGGAYVYIERAFGKAGRACGIIFALAFLVNTFATGCVMQGSAAVSGVREITGKGGIWMSIPLALTVFLSCRKGIERVSSLTSKLVPVMSTVWLVLTVLTVFVNRENLPHVLSDILCGAFDGRSASAGVGAVVFSEVVRTGVMRGLLSNEAGAGSSATAHASERNTTPDRQGCMGVAEVFFDTAVMCTVSALAFLTSGVKFYGRDDIGIAMDALYITGGSAFSTLGAASVWVFGFATLVCFSAYGGECISYITKKESARSALSRMYLFVFCAFVALSPFIRVDLFLDFADASMSVMTVLNVAALILLWTESDRTYRDRILHQ